jgi:UV DNA damage endonuclease
LIVRFGYVAMSVHLTNASPSQTMTATQFQRLPDREAAIRKLERIAADNLHNTLRILRYNLAEQIYVYRLSSKLIPLQTHEWLSDWDPYVALDVPLQELGEYARQHRFRLSFHPDHFTVFSTPRQDVLRKSQQDLERHVSLFEHIGLDERYKCNIHIGGTYGDKAAAQERFMEHISQLPERLRNRLTLENDDKTFTAKETLDTAQALGLPMVLDLHHHAVNHQGEHAADLWEDIQQTWSKEATRLNQVGDELLVPKIHISSPKSEKEKRAHADYVEVGPFLEFATAIAPFTPRLDVMIEAKRKDAALLQLMQELCNVEGVRKINGAALEMFSSSERNDSTRMGV